MRVLVVEDEPKVADALRDGLEAEHYEVLVEYTGEGAFERMTTEAFDLVVLDLGLPGRDGLEVLAAMRKKGVGVPVVVLTARDGIADRVAGLDAGADDYLVKPFAFAELLRESGRWRAEAIAPSLFTSRSARSASISRPDVSCAIANRSS